MLLTKSTGLLGPIANILGYIMDAIFNFCTLLMVPNIGLCIILFTIVIYMLLMPLTVKQQKFSKLSAKMNPELQAVKKKYDGKKDQISMTKMNEETNDIYAKYGVSPMGSCLQMLIQMPILFALYRVIWNIPAYVSGVEKEFLPLAEKILSISGSQSQLTEFASKNQVNFEKLGYTTNTIIDCLYKFKPGDWADLAVNTKLAGINDLVLNTHQKVSSMNNFLGIDISNSPWLVIQEAIKPGNFQILLLLSALIIPLLSGLTQWLSMKLMPSANTNAASGETGSMESSMKAMNNIMPLMSVAFCFTVPAGMGIYWIAGAVIRSIQQVIVNKHLDRVDLDELVAKNLEKENKKRQKMGLPPQKITNQAKINVRNIQTPEKKVISQEEKQKQIQNSTEYYKNNTEAKPGSIAAKARMVQKYNDKNKK